MNTCVNRQKRRRQSGAALQEYMALMVVMVMAVTPGVISFTGGILKPLCVSNSSFIASSAVSEHKKGVSSGNYFSFYYGNYGGKTHHHTRCYTYQYDVKGNLKKTLVWDTW